MAGGIKVFVAIAVSNPEGDLDKLDGAITAADDLVHWANATGMYDHVVRITDEKTPGGSDNPVSLQRLCDEIEPLINKRGEARDRIVIAFAGHGVTVGSRDLWLLSQWDSKEEVVDVERMWRNLATYQPAQITVISDACRSPPSDNTMLIQGSRVFTKMAWKPSKPDLDLLLATGLGKPAYMVRGKDDQKPYCLFTHVVTNGLWGRYADSIDMFRPGIVSSQSLKKAIVKELPAAANALNQSQEAEILAGFSPPEDVYMTLAGAPSAVQALEPQPTGDELPPPPPRAPSPSDFMVGFEVARSDPARWLIQRTSRPRPVDAAEARRDLAGRFAFALRQLSGLWPTHFETGTGVAMVGAHIQDVAVGTLARADLDTSPQAPPESRGRWWVLNGPPGSMAVQAAERGDWVAAALFPRMIANFTLDERGAVALVYRSGASNPSEHQAEIAAATEEAIAEMHAGTLTGEPARNLAAHIRQWKHVDPVLGVIAAYLYARLNDIGSIHRLAWFYVASGQPIPFDIALLGGMRMTRLGHELIADVPKTQQRLAQSGLEGEYDFTTQPTPAASGPVAGGFPWLRQGWDLLDDIDPDAFAPLIDLTKGLTPALFTTLRPDEGAALAKLIREGRV